MKIIFHLTTLLVFVFGTVSPNEAYAINFKTDRLKQNLSHILRFGELKEMNRLLLKKIEELILLTIEEEKTM